MVVVLIGALLFVRFVLFNDEATQLTTAEALERYRSSTVAERVLATTTSVAAEIQTLPLTGVYRYATEGRESIDALEGTEHVYPDETTITYATVGCGVEMRWDALVERHDEWNLCVTDAGIELQSNAHAYHVFFGQEEIEPILCDRTVLLIPSASTDQAATEAVTGDPWISVTSAKPAAINCSRARSVDVSFRSVATSIARGAILARGSRVSSPTAPASITT